MICGASFGDHLWPGLLNQRSRWQGECLPSIGMLSTASILISKGGARLFLLRTENVGARNFITQDQFLSRLQLSQCL